MSVLRDLFYGPGNVGADLARIIGAFAVVIMAVAVGHNMRLGQPIDLLALGTGLGAVLTSIALFVTGKDYARAANITAQKGEGEK